MKDKLYLGRRRHLILMVLIISALILISGFFYFRFEYFKAIHNKQNELKSISELKINQISQWRAERLANANLRAQSPYFAKAVELFSTQKEYAYLRGVLLKQLEALRVGYGNENVFITSSHGDLLLSSDTGLTTMPSDSYTSELIQWAVTSKEVIFSEVYHSQEFNAFYINIIAPLSIENGNVVGAIVFQINPKNFLFPLIQSWPTPSKTSESLIVQKEGDSVHILNTPRFRESTAGPLRFPLTAKEKPSVQAILGQIGSTEGVDYRANHVLADIRKVPFTRWYIVSKVDKSEIFSDLFIMTIIIATFTLFLILLAGVTITWIYHYRQKNAYKLLFLKEKDLSDAQQQLQNTYRLAKIGAWEWNSSLNSFTWSEELLEIAGFDSSQSTPGIDELPSMFVAGDWDRLKAAAKSALERRNPFHLELQFIRQDGDVRCVSTFGETLLDKEGCVIGLNGTVQDITTQRLSEEKIRKSEAKYISIFENTGTATLLVEEDMTISMANIQNFQMTGYTPEELVGRKWIQFVDPLSLEIMQKNHLLRRAHPGMAPDKYEVKLIRKDGQVRDTVISIGMIQNTKQSIVSMFDITDHKQAQEALIESREIYKVVADKMTDVVWLMDLSGKSLFVSPSITQFTGYSIEEYLNQTIDDRFTPESAKIANQILKEKMQDVSKFPEKFKGYSLSLQLEYRCKDNQTKWGELMISPYFGKNNHLNGLHGATRDISERKSAEENVRKLSRGVEQSPVSMIFTNLEGRIEFVNPKFTEMTGYISDEIIGKVARILKPGSTSPELHQKIWETILSGKEWKGEFISKKKSGVQYWESISVSPIMDWEGSITNFILITEDISDRKNMIKELTSSRDQAEESDKLKSAFLANMSHEIRTPMNSIIGFADLLSDPELTVADRKRFTQIIKSRSNDLMHLVNDLLELSRIESGNAVIVQERVALNDIIDEIQTIFLQKLHSIDNKDIELSFSKPLSDDQAIINSDVYVVKQVFSNLIDNAIKFTSHGVIHFGYLPPKANEITCFVSDTGVGISNKNQQVIFEHFRQAEMTDPHKYGGTGLGLSICKGSLALCGGRIWVESDPGEGSTFYFTLPFKPMAKSGYEPIKAIVTELPREDQQGQFLWTGKRLLLVEDEETNLEFLKVILKKKQPELICIKTAFELRNLYSDLETFDIILLDLRLPDAEGWDLVREIKDRRPDLPVIAQTAYAMSSDRQKCLEKGFDNFISKPINREILIKMISGYLGRNT